MNQNYPLNTEFRDCEHCEDYAASAADPDAPTLVASEQPREQHMIVPALLFRPVN
jgi:hypothetical protein